MRLARARFAGLVAVPVLVMVTLAGAGTLAYQAAGTGPAGAAPATAAGTATPSGALHEAALQRAFAISDQAYADEALAVPADAPAVVVPRGPLPDGMTLFAASDQGDGARSSGPPIASAIVAE